ncbi:MAG: DUF3604 domain-containing protein [Deltaproteobacteria bacterium]|nr:DUF3604 domain-containing protein [Deltaproteobacteria bacterium]
MHVLRLVCLAAALGGAGSPGRSWAQPATEPPPFTRTEARAECAQYDPLRRPFFGDLHIHTALSFDASTQGTRAMPADAYRFARGERLGVQPFAADGSALRHLQLDRPLDFAAVTDHAELFGEITICDSPDLPGYDSLPCVIRRRWPRLAFFMINAQTYNSPTPTRFAFCGADAEHCRAAARTPWRVVQEAAEAFYDRSAACAFTTFVAYEWSGSPGTNNLHRNVIFRNDDVPALPLSFVDEPVPQRFLARLERECPQAGGRCDVLTIPHNSNLSNGIMFPVVEPDGQPLSRETARLRHDWEPLVEVMQHKGDSECALGGETTDEQCGFEKLPYQNFGANFMPILTEPAPPSAFVRNALKSGLEQQARLGVNPFQYGIIASTDTHIGAAGGVRPDTFVGHGGAGAPPDTPGAGLPDDIEFNPGGLAVLYAEENSRDALFAAMRRREVYGTSGPRMVVRVFGGWSYPADLCDAHDFVARGYAAGVPMGGVLPRAPRGGGAPVFAISALRDPASGPSSAPLQQVQIIKGWLDGTTSHEKVYDVAATPAATGVDPATCAPRDDEGAASLCTVWRDPDFDPTQAAFYYVRVLQTPTCRWSTYACNAREVDCRDPAHVPAALADCCDARYPRTIQARAWTSPIWYAPPPFETGTPNPPSEEGASNPPFEKGGQGGFPQ